MPRPPLVSLLACISMLACTPRGTTSTATPCDTSKEHAAAAAALDAEIVTTAIQADRVLKMKVRVDAQGNIVKQSVYHDKADALPKPVLEAAEARFPGATVLHYETELYADRGRVYEVEVDDAGKHCELAATPEGAEVYVECEVDPTSLSAEIRAAIEKTAPGGTILEAETKRGPEIDEVTVEVQQAEGELYLRMRPDGSILQVLRRVPGFIEVPLP
ncbi:PepSY domain-containing protein [Nannocystaceae bacterium ST9]